MKNAKKRTIDMFESAQKYALVSEKGDMTIKVKVMKSNTNDTFRLKPIKAKPDTKNNEKPRGKVAETVAETEVRASIIGPDRAMKSTSDCSTVESNVDSVESNGRPKYCRSGPSISGSYWQGKSKIDV